MKKQTVFKKLLSSIMVAIIVLGQFSSYSFVSKAATISGGDGPIYILLSKTNENGNGYALDMNSTGGAGKSIWSMMYSTDGNSSNAQNASNLYCIKAEYGDTWAINPSAKVQYNKTYSIPLKQETEQVVANDVLLGDYKNEILWLIDQLYIQGESDQEDFAKYLKNAGIIYEEGYGYSYVPTTEHDYTNIVSTSYYSETVLEEDIIAVQQAAIWYFTNYGENSNIYDKAGVANWIQYTNETLLNNTTGQNKYPQLSSASQARAEHAIVIYNYLINEAKSVAKSIGDKEYELKHTHAKLWLSIAQDGTANNEQPAIEVHKIEEKPFDLSLRKAIVAINDNKELVNIDGESATRDLNDNGSIKNIDTTTLTSGTTATYKHRKDPVLVKTGDTVTYSITIYNESEEAGYANKIIDRLPGTWGTGIRLQNNQTKVTSTTGNIYNVEYVASSNEIIVTMAEESPKNALAPYNSQIGTLTSETILINCVVMGKADAANAKVLTNIAYIAEEYNAYFDTIITKDTVQDRDSQTWESPKVPSNNLVSTDIGYIGNINNEKDLSKNENYYAGEQDDDDFEKIVILPESFDLSLRKNITKVNGEEVSTRTPEVDANNLKNSTDTTAEYKHRKDAVAVKNGDIVEYNISLYNEGSIDGVAKIIRDQLPTGLKLNKEIFDKVGEEYFVTSLKGNEYKVIYDEANNLVSFELIETDIANMQLLKAYVNGQALDKDIITLECVVECTANEKENTYLTNIAYIYEALQEDGTIVTNQKAGTDKAQDADRDSEPHTIPNKTAGELQTIGNIGYIGNNSNANKELGQSSSYFKGEQDDDDFEKLVILPKTFDLKLIKFITQINGEKTENRVISVDTSKLNTTDATTAEYILEKNPISIKSGDFVTYTLRVYNEGHYDGYATKISENIPEGLEFLVITDGKIHSWDGVELKDITEEIKNSSMYNKIVDVNSNWGYTQGSTEITTKALSEDLIKGFGQENVEYADKQNKIDYKEVQVIFRVKENVEPNKIIRNEASISEDKVIENNGQEINVSDRDSKPEEWKKENSDKTYDQEGKWPIYKEDDEDYDNIITKAFDLSLRKQVIKVNDAFYTARFAKLDANGEYENTLYDYYDVYNNKLKVKSGDIVVYSIRVYNEGDIDGYANLIVDKLPSGLEFYSSVYQDIDYGWKLVEGSENTYQTDYLSYKNDKNKGTEASTIIKAYTGNGEADYQEIYILCKVKEDVTKADKLLNVAQIAEHSDSEGNQIKDKDSVPGTSDDENKWKVEDDLDIELLEIQEFDLALRKFITQIENGEKVKEVTTRIPQISYDKETNKIVYTHSKDALVVHVGDTVIYTIRVYNEGEIDGYAKEIKDNIPEYLEYLPKHETNIENQWVMYDKDGKVTEKVEEAEYICTEYLAKGKGVEADSQSGKTNLLEAFDATKEISEVNPNYKEVKVAFKVKDPNSTEQEIINFAQISEDTDSEGNPIKDRDSVPDNGKEEPKEDDEDIEKVKVEYFDLSLLKYVTKVLINENGQERIIETGNIGDENDIIPHVQMNKKNIYKTTVKFVYTIQIKNEGQIVGEATEITDYVPEGLQFVAEDNELWTDEGNNVISTKQLTGTTLQPGETAEVEVTLRWINGEENFGAKTNVAEISEDYNEENVPDKDSTPDNKEEGEDDIDEATVLLSVNQGGGIPSIYTNTIITFLAIILVGTILIKKFVL